MITGDHPQAAIGNERSRVIGFPHPLLIDMFGPSIRRSSSHSDGSPGSGPGCGPRAKIVCGTKMTRMRVTKPLKSLDLKYSKLVIINIV
ncbi:hypothetical protein CEXT_784261 [Caerostris extrusa]|uniref:Uncharacterized protein n=1 Tax=Caerostris extrusa TaxID=172846 RepID=A0AAV4MJX5_CAEEX|nr:hypothetical protein CEXT_784261 [Caerostris extrusa]